MAASRRRPLLALALLGAVAAAPAHSQARLSVSGQVVRSSGADTVPVAGAGVTLHRISRTAQGAVDSARTGADGRFRFGGAADTSAVYLVSARYAGIEYFGTPLRPPGAAGIRLLVSDTSSSAPIRLAARRVIIRPPDETGTRIVLDLFSLRNDGPDTRIGRDSVSPSWEVVLPAGILEAEVQEGDVSPTAVQFRGDTLAVLAPIGPGEKNVMVSYRLPIGIGASAWSAPADTFDVMVVEGGATVTGAGLEAAAPMTVMDTEVHRWTASPPPPGSAALVRFGDGTGSGRRTLLWLVGIVALVVCAGSALAWRRGRSAGAIVGTPIPADLVGALAALDARYAGRRAEVSREEWERYQSERATLKAAALARGSTRR